MQTAFDRSQRRVAGFAVVLPGVLPDDGVFPFKRFDSRKIDTVHGDVFLALRFIRLMKHNLIVYTQNKGSDHQLLQKRRPLGRLFATVHRRAR